MTTTLEATARATYGGIVAQMYAWRGEDEIEQRVNRCQDIIEQAGNSYVMLVYDIPTAKDRDCPNPSRLLWGHGFRLNFSCWVMPKDQLEAPEVLALLAHWGQHRIRTHVIEYAETQMEVVRAIAREKLDEEVRRVHTSLIRCIDAADKALHQAMDCEEWQALSEQEREAAFEEQVARRNDRVRSRIKLAVREFTAALKCAELFDETEQLADLLEGVRSAIRARREAFNATAQAAGVRQVAETV